VDHRAKRAFQGPQPARPFSAILGPTGRPANKDFSELDEALADGEKTPYKHQDASFIGARKVTPFSSLPPTNPLTACITAGKHDKTLCKVVVL
jgi:hypothetical protein